MKREINGPIISDEIADILSDKNLAQLSKSVSKEAWINYRNSGFDEHVIRDMRHQISDYLASSSRFPVQIENRQKTLDAFGGRTVEFRTEIFALNRREWVRLCQYVRILERENEALKRISPPVQP